MADVSHDVSDRMNVHRHAKKCNNFPGNQSIKRSWPIVKRVSSDRSNFHRWIYVNSSHSDTHIIPTHPLHCVLKIIARNSIWFWKFCLSNELGRQLIRFVSWPGLGLRCFCVEMSKQIHRNTLKKCRWFHMARIVSHESMLCGVLYTCVQNRDNNIMCDEYLTNKTLLKYYLYVL